MKKKRLMSLVLAISMLFGGSALLPENSFVQNTNICADAYVSGNYEYDVLEDGTVMITRYNGNETDITIPSKLGGRKVTVIGYESFKYNNDIKSVKIPYGVTEIVTRAFFCCENIKKVIIPNTVRKIGIQAFYECTSLTSINIPDSVKVIEEAAFQKCSKLKSVKIGKNVDAIYGEAFEDTLWLDDMRTKDPLVIVNNILIDGKRYDKTALVIPDGVKTIGAYSFRYNNSIKKVTMPDSVTIIDYQAFYYCSYLSDVKYSSKLKTISYYAFGYCSNLKYSELPSTVSFIGIGAFQRSGWLSSYYYNGCGKVSGSYYIAVVNGILFDTSLFNGSHLDIPDSVHTIGGGAFMDNKKIQTVTIPNSVKVLAEDAFTDSKITELNIPDSVEYIDDCAINDCSELKTINIGSGVKEISFEKYGNFDDDKLKSINVDKNNKNFSSVNGVLYDKAKKVLIACPCKKDKITIPDSVTRIETEAFSRCYDIKTINIPAGFNNLRNEPVNKLSGLLSINVDKNNKTYCSIDGVVYNKARTKLVYCPLSKPKVSVPDGVTTIGSCAFNSYYNLKSIIIPKSVTKIEEDAFLKETETTIYCYKGSVAEKYAKRRQIKYVLSPTPAPKQTRLAGANRYETASIISKKMNPKTSGTVIIATGLTFHDAMVAVPLASAHNAPLLLATEKHITAQTEAELKRLKAKNVIVVSTNGAIGAKAKAEFKALKYKMTYIEGKTCFETAAKVAKALQTKTKKAPDTIFFATDSAFADALSASPVAAIKGAPIIYLKKTGSIDSATANYLKSVKGKVKNAYIIGGDRVISNAMMKNVAKALGLTVNKTVQRVAGANRYETCVAVNKKFKSVLPSDGICVAKGLDFPDALAGGVYAAATKQALFLADGKKLLDCQNSYLKSKNAAKITVFGGTNAVPDSLVKLIAKASI